MMIRAYDEIYLDSAMETLGAAVEYAVLFCGLEGQEFFDLFAASGIADEFGRGNVKFVAGMSGIDLARTVFAKCGKTADGDTELPYIDYPPEYWVGWIAAYYQWYAAKPFSLILKRIGYQAMRNLYGILHEADPRKAVEVFDEHLAGKAETQLAAIRKARGMSQSQLAKASGVSLRSIQLYEQRKNDVNVAQYNHIKALADALGCKVDALLETQN